MSSTHGGSLEGIVSGMISLLKVELPDYLTEENDRITANFSGPSPPDELIGYMDDVSPSRRNLNKIRVFADGDDTVEQFMGSVNEDSYQCTKIGILWEFSCSLEQMGTWKRTMYQAIRRAVLAKWKHYLGPASAYHIQVAGDMRSGSPRQQGTKSSNVYTALEVAKGSTTETLTVIVAVKYVFSEDVSH